MKIKNIWNHHLVMKGKFYWTNVVRSSVQRINLYDLHCFAVECKRYTGCTTGKLSNVMENFEHVCMQCTAPKTNGTPKLVLCRCFSFSKEAFSGSMLNFGDAHKFRTFKYVYHTPLCWNMGTTLVPYYATWFWLDDIRWFNSHVLMGFFVGRLLKSATFCGSWTAVAT